jgi:hypothetical protein
MNHLSETSFRRIHQLAFDKKARERTSRIKPRRIRCKVLCLYKPYDPIKRLANIFLWNPDCTMEQKHRSGRVQGQARGPIQSPDYIGNLAVSRRAQYEFPQ